jgi:hypothetical protein
MLKLTFASLLTAFSCAFAVAEDSVVLPKDVPPVMGTAEAIPPDPGYNNWYLKLVIPKVTWNVVGERKPKREWPELKVNVEEATLNLQIRYGPATQLAEDAQNRVLDVNGKRLGVEEISERLGSKAPVLVSVSGRMPDPFYLQCTKPDTLIVVLGIPSAPAPELLPQPAEAKENTK